MGVQAAKQVKTEGKVRRKEREAGKMKVKDGTKGEARKKKKRKVRQREDDTGKERYKTNF